MQQWLLQKPQKIKKKITFKIDIIIIKINPGVIKLLNFDKSVLALWPIIDIVININAVTINASQTEVSVYAYRTVDKEMPIENE